MKILRWSLKDGIEVKRLVVETEIYHGFGTPKISLSSTGKKKINVFICNHFFSLLNLLNKSFTYVRFILKSNKSF